MNIQDIQKGEEKTLNIRKNNIKSVTTESINVMKTSTKSLKKDIQP